MNSYGRKEVVTTEIVYSMSTEGPWGLAIGEFFKLIATAESEAKRLGLKTDYDDWASIRSDDENIEIAFTTKAESRD